MAALSARSVKEMVGKIFPNLVFAEGKCACGERSPGRIPDLKVKCPLVSIARSLTILSGLEKRYNFESHVRNAVPFEPSFMAVRMSRGIGRFHRRPSAIRSDAAVR